MYRDDKGGWVPAALKEYYKVVGTDFRGLPVVHIGRGRPNLKMVKLLQKNPDASEDSDLQLLPVESTDTLEETGLFTCVLYGLMLSLQTHGECT